MKSIFEIFSVPNYVIESFQIASFSTVVETKIIHLTKKMKSGFRIFFFKSLYSLSGIKKAEISLSMQSDYMLETK
jgi:hypothetical protein